MFRGSTFVGSYVYGLRCMGFYVHGVFRSWVFKFMDSYVHGFLRSWGLSFMGF